MPGGDKNIKPEDGNQFSSEYQPEEKWTEEKALQLADDLIEWLLIEETNIFVNEFLAVENDYPECLVTYLSKKFSSFSQVMKRAKRIQETKLIKFGVFDKLNAPMTKFALINHHDWKDKKDITTDDQPIQSMPKIEFVRTPDNVEDTL